LVRLTYETFDQLTNGIPLVLGILVPVAGPDLLKVGHNVVTPEQKLKVFCKFMDNVVTPEDKSKVFCKFRYDVVTPELTWKVF
jgi:hypothetical protein